MPVTMKFEMNELSLVDFHTKRTSEKVDVFLRNEKYVQCSPFSQGARVMPFLWYILSLITWTYMIMMIDTTYSQTMHVRGEIKWSSILTNDKGRGFNRIH